MPLLRLRWMRRRWVPWRGRGAPTSRACTRRARAWIRYRRYRRYRRVSVAWRPRRWTLRRARRRRRSSMPSRGERGGTLALALRPLALRAVRAPGLRGGHRGASLVGALGQRIANLRPVPSEPRLHALAREILDALRGALPQLRLLQALILCVDARLDPGGAAQLLEERPAPFFLVASHHRPGSRAASATTVMNVMSGMK